MLSTSFWWRPAVVALALASPAVAQDGLRWEDSLGAARRLAAQSNRLVLLHFTAPSCEPCQRLEQQVFRDPGFGRELVGNFVAVKINVDLDPATARQYGVRAIPADAVIKPSGELIELVNSPPNGPEFVSTMNRIAAAGLAPPRDPSRPDPAAVAGAMQSPAYPPPGQPNSQGSIAPPPARQPADPRFIPASGPAAAPASGPVAQGATGPDERYTDYYNRRRADAAARTAAPYVDQDTPQANDRYAQRTDNFAGPGNAPPANSPPAQPAIHPDYYAVQPPTSPSTGNPPPAGPPPSAQPPVTPGGAVAQPASPPRNTPQLPPGCAPLGLDGYCPVTLCEKPDGWTVGDTRWGVQHRGRTYLFAGPEQQRKFLASPDRYAPVLSGNDPVLALDHGQSVAGSRTHGGFYGGRIYLFSSETSYQQFSQNPNRYAAEILQAELSSSKR